MGRVRRELRVRGAVQGVGFRPWAMRRARALGLAGAARNAPDGLHVALEGPEEAIARFLAELRAQPPRGARIEGLDVAAAAPRGESDFAIAESALGAAYPDPRLRLPLDTPVCEACLDEIFDPAARRHRYPFTHCAACGPRAAVLLGLPWDRERSTLRSFPPCPACRAEYEDPADRRHHAESIACAACGPSLCAFDADRRALGGDAVELAAEALRSGSIVALKGYGGYHLAVDATQAAAIARLRARKGRPSKPFALLVPDLPAARRLAALGPAEEALLAGPVHAVVLAPRRREGCAAIGLAQGVAPGLRDLGLLLPYAPLHHLLFHAPGSTPDGGEPRFRALVLTSANASGEPTLHDDAEAADALAAMADVLVAHGRAVSRPHDDPVYRSAPSGPIPIRLSRGTAPLAFPLPGGLRAPVPIAAIGGDLECAPALACGGEVVLAEHVGDLLAAAAADAALRRVRDLARLLGVDPAVAAHDLHPGYVGTALAPALAPRTIAVQHHHAHAAACLVEHARAGPVLALALDGLGFGSDGTLWGGELLRVELTGCERLAHLETVPLPGGDAATREPWRMAAVWLERAFPDGSPRLPWHARRDANRLRAVLALAARGIASPTTSSCGRLFDAVASLLDLVDEATHEAEAAAALEARAEEADGAAALALDAPPSDARAIPMAGIVRALVRARAAGAPVPALAAAFHAALAARLADAAVTFGRRLGLDAVVLTGGCFQNRLLLESLRQRLAAGGLEALVHQRLPPGDGALAVGQAAVAAARLAAGG